MITSQTRSRDEERELNSGFVKTLSQELPFKDIPSITKVLRLGLTF
jgi:hypothetical protein